ncbi:hypothetical protein R3P38DRAFT_3214421 [Favolaschia claudopus]|uniref:Uncharacterized protein n=1 Tax=Favolaschia claudopus TaxID=2862362 RepID=A0AAW0AC45_9AGAR
MDLGAHFDREGAKLALEKFIQDRVNESKDAKETSVQYFARLNALHEVDRQVSNRREWKLAALSGSEVVPEEVAFRLHGVLAKINLAPGEIAHLNAYKASSLTQRVQLVGLGSHAFDDMLLNTKVVTDIFRRHLGGQHSPVWKIGEGYGDLQMNCSCLYLTKAFNRPEREVAFGPGVDPFKKFARYKPQGYIHTAANVVKYFKRVDEEGKRVLYECFPGTFRVGDIVEVQGSVIAFPVKDGMVKMVFQMNTLILEDASFSKAAEHARAREYNPPQRPMQLKRKSWYEEEDEDMEVGGARRKFKDLRLETAHSYVG